MIQPSQIGMVHRVYTPTPEEIKKARRIVEALKEAENKGSGVIALDGRMIDKPVVERAERTLELARAAGIFSPDLRIGR